MAYTGIGPLGTVYIGNGSGEPIFSATPSVTSITITNAPVLGTDGTNKAYVDMIAAGFEFKDSCQAASTVPLTVTYSNGVAGIGATLTNADTQAAFAIDGYTASLGDRILIKNQSSTFQNGIYTVTVLGSGITNWVLTRSLDYDMPSQIHPGDVVAVINGTANATTLWLQTAVVTTIGTDPIVFVGFLSNSGITTLAGDAGSATGTTVTISGGTTGLTTSASGSTMDITGTLIVGNGGTGATTFTSHGVLLGNTTSAITATAAGTTGQVLTGVTGSAPTFQSPAASSITITGDSGGGLTGNSFTFTASGIGLSFAGAGSTETLGGILKLANGGTNANLTASNGGIFYSTATAGAILAGTATANQVLLSGSSTIPAWSTATYPATTTINQLLYSSANNVIGGVTAGNFGVLISSSSGVPSWLANGTTGQILTATTSGTPSWASAASTSISITGDSGGALTGNAFTFTGGTTGLTFAGAGSTETLGGTLAIANGGTNATSMSTSTGIVKYDGTRLVTSTTAKIDSSNRMTNTSQPAFLAYLSADLTNITGASVTYTVIFNSTSYDQASNFNTSTGVFTAPVTGIYNVGYTMYFSGVAAGNTIGNVRFIATSGTWESYYGNAGTYVSGNGVCIISNATNMKMTANDTLHIDVFMNGSTQTIGLSSNGGTPTGTRFYGELIC